MSKPISYWIAMASCLILGAALLYLAVLTETSGGGKGFWLFSAFGICFLLPPTAMLVRALHTQPDDASPQASVFAPHWQFVSAIVIFLLVVLATVVAAVMS